MHAQAPAVVAHALVALGMAGLLAAASVHADPGNASGYFRKGDSRIEVRHAVAAYHLETGDPETDDLYVFLSDQPLDPAVIAASFDPDDGAQAQYRERKGGFVRICLPPTGGECGLYFQRNEPSDSFNSSGYGTLSIDTRSDTRIAGRWVLAEPEDFFGKTYEFDLRFDTAITPAPGQRMPDNGGEAGAAYKAYAAAVAKGDIAALRRMLGESGQWQFAGDDDARAKEALKDLRNEQPLAPVVFLARAIGDHVVLWVEGTDRDDIKRRGRVQMRREGGQWVVGERDLDSVDE
jgi:hypothetical protein